MALPPTADSVLESVSGAGRGAEREEPVTPAQPVHPYLHVVIVAVLGALVTFGFPVVFERGTEAIWENGVVNANRWLIPVISVGFALFVGLLVKYRNAPTTLNESMIDSLSGDVSRIEWRTLPVHALRAWVSLFSGAVLGPEGGIGGISSKLAALYSEKVGAVMIAHPYLVAVLETRQAARGGTHA